MFHASASSRSTQVVGVAVQTVQTSNRRRLQFAGKPAGTALSALRYLGKGKVTLEMVKAIAVALGPSGFERLRSIDMQVWMQNVFAGAAGNPDLLG